MSDPAASASARSPWKGLVPYEESDVGLFFGRDAETDEILALFERDSLSVLYGPSGIGKTSLLRAGVFPRLRSKRALPVYVRLAHQDGADDLDRQVLTAVAAAARAAKVEAPPFAEQDDLWRHFHAKGHRFWDESQWPITPVVVVDQFEEIFTLGRENDVRRLRSRAFLDSLSELVENRPPPDIRDRLRGPEGEAAAHELEQAYTFEDVPVRVVLSLRQDYLSSLETLRPLLPTIRQNRMGLAALSRVQALKIIEEPARRVVGGPLLAQGAATAIVDFVATGGRQVEEVMLDDERPIEPAFLSLFCDELYRRRGGQAITTAQVHSQEGEILRGFYESAFEDVPEAERATVRAFVEDELVTHTGHRDSRDVADATMRGAVSQRALDALRERRLLRHEDRPGGGRRVELSHDVLLAVATQSRSERQRRAREAELLSEREAETAKLARARREKEQADARERRTKALLIVTAIGLGTALIGSVFGYRATRRSNDEERIATALGKERTLTAATADFDLARRYVHTDPVRAVAHLARALRFKPDYWAAATLLRNVLTGRRWVTRQGMALEHDGQVWSAVFSPDGRRVLTAASDRTARIWDAETNALLLTLEGHEERVTRAAYSPDGRLIATASEDETARIWDASTGRPVCAPLQHAMGVNTAVFSPDSALLATAAEDGVTRVWSARSGKKLHEFSPAGGKKDWDTVASASFSGDGKKLLIVTNADVSVRDVQTGKAVLRPLPVRKISAAGWSPDGRSLLITADGIAGVHDAITGKRRFVLKKDDRDVGVYSADYSPEGTEVVLAAENDVTIWDALSGKREGAYLHAKPGIPFTSARFSPDGRRVLTISSAGGQLWDSEAEEQSQAFTSGLGIGSASFSPDGLRIVTVTSSDRTAHIWNIVGAKTAPEQLLHKGKVDDTTLDREERRVGTVSGKTFQVWDIATAKPIGKPLVLEKPINWAALIAARNRVMTMTASGEARIWDTSTGLAVSRPLLADAWLSFSPDRQKVISWQKNGSIKIWATATGTELGHLDNDVDLDTATFVGGGANIIITSSRSPAASSGHIKDGVVRFWDAMSGKPVGTPIANAGLMKAVSKSGRYLLTVSGQHGQPTDGAVQLWDRTTMRPTRLRQDEVTVAAFSPDERLLLTVTRNNRDMITIWDVASAGRAFEPVRLDDDVKFGEFSADNRMFLTVSGSDVKLWDSATGAPLGEPLQPLETKTLSDARFTSDGRYVLAVPENGERVSIFDLGVTELPCPEWFTRWAEGFVGGRLDSNGVLDRAVVRDAIPVHEPKTTFRRTAEWLVTEGPSRTLAPGGTRTVWDWASDNLADRTLRNPEVLRRTHDQLPGDPLFMAMLSEFYAQQWKKSRPPADELMRLGLYTRWATEHARINAEDEDGRAVRPRQASVHFRAATAWKDLHETKNALDAARRAASLDPAHADYADLVKELEAAMPPRRKPTGKDVTDNPLQGL